MRRAKRATKRQGEEEVDREDCENFVFTPRTLGSCLAQRSNDRPPALPVVRKLLAMPINGYSQLLAC